MGGPLTLERAGGGRIGFLANPKHLFRPARADARRRGIEAPGTGLQGEEDGDG
jgi:hypothetical protein